MSTELCRVPREGGFHYFSSMPDITSFAYIPDASIDDKASFISLFEAHTLPVPRSNFFLTKKSGLRFFKTLQRPAVVKPRMGSRARHTTLDIRSESDFMDAAQNAKRISPWYMVQAFIPGDLYRATCVGGAVAGIVHFIKPEIEADGVLSARELLAKHNASKRFPNLTDVKDDELFRACLKRQSLAPHSIPARGVQVLLAEHSERPNGGYFVDCTESIPPQNIALIENAAHVAKVAVVGFDIISHDLTVAHTDESMAFIEANSLPFIELHAIPYEGKPRNVAAAIWDLWEKYARER